MMPAPDTPRDPASLEHLHDIVAPGPVPWWPPAPGWYALGLLLAAAVVWAAAEGVLRWRRNRYRREALQELRRLQAASLRPEETETAIAGLAELLKRVALAAWPREAVASLSGERWLRLMQATGRGPGLPADVLDRLAELPYRGRSMQETTAPAVAQLFAAAKEWILTHDAAALDPAASVRDP